MDTDDYTVCLDPSVEDLIPGFLKKVYSDMHAINTLVDQAEYEQVAVLAQKIKGDGGSYGFEKLTEFGRMIETAARKTDPDAIIDTVKRLSDFLERVKVIYEFKNLIVLCVDDDKYSLNLTKRLLSGKDYDVVTALSGNEALKKLESFRPQLILLDVVMPEMDGYAVCKKLQQNRETENIPVIFLTAMDEEKDKSRALSFGVVDYITKPIDKSELLTKVDRHINTVSRWRQVESEELSAEHSEGTGFDFSGFKEYFFEKFNLPVTIRMKYSELSGNLVYTLMIESGIEEDAMTRMMAEYLGLSYVDEIDPLRIQLGILPASFCRSNLAVLILDDADEYCLVMGNPFLEGIVQKVRKYINTDSALKLLLTKPDNILDLSLASSSV